MSRFRMSTASSANRNHDVKPAYNLAGQSRRVGWPSTLFKVRAFLLITFLAVACCTAIGQTHDPSATNLLAQCFSAMGSPDKDFGEEAWGTITDSDHADLPSRPLSVIAVGLHRLRIEEQFSDRRWIHTVNGLAAKRSDNPKKTSLSPLEAVFRTPEYINAYNCSPSGARAAGNISYVGREIYNGMNTDHIHLQVAQGASGTQKFIPMASELDLYLNAESHLLVALRRQAIAADALENHFTLETRFSEYQQVGRVWLPARIEHIFRGSPADVIVLTNIQQLARHNQSDFQQ